MNLQMFFLVLGIPIAFIGTLGMIGCAIIESNARLAFWFGLGGFCGLILTAIGAAL